MPEDTAVVPAPQPGPVSQWLTRQGFEHEQLEPDHLGVEVIGIEAPFLPVIAAAGEAAFPPVWFFVLAVPLSMLGTTLGGELLERMSDVDFKRAMKWLVTAIGAAMLLKAAGWL